MTRWIPARAHKLAAGFAVTLMALGGVAAVGASGAGDHAAEVLEALGVTDRTPDQADAHIDAIGSGAEGSDGDPNENANDNASEGAGNADDGIGNSNASDQGLDHANDNAFDGAGNADDKGDNANSDLPDQANGHASGAGEHPDLPDQANDHAEDGAENARPSDNVPDHVELPFD